ncbi:hypothetical protein HJFPF1_02783 [Paramyrothecium foliicola]|nr:hypothetical protein HJFPF1_02783 [Paramyrothecium foliicola]
MSIGRLTFLYPHLMRAARPGGGPMRATGVASLRYKGTFAPRHGKGVEPPNLDNQQRQLLKAVEVPAEAEGSIASLAEQSPAEAAREPSEAQKAPGEGQNSIPADEAVESDSNEASSASPDAGPDPAEAEENRARQVREQAKQSGPLEAILHAQPPEDVARQHPAMSPPPYVHHFDTYSLVKQVQEGGFTQAQSITAMKGIRTLLAQNLEVAQASLVSKSDVENETYLFRAACSELSTEIRNNRRLQDEQIRQQRTHLQHEVDILTQSMNQELLTLNDNVKGMFNDRRMVVREEQKAMDSRVQQISYKISIMLSSDSRSEIEGLRWVLIRRSVLGIIFMAVLTLGTLRYGSYLSHERVKEAERKKKEEEEFRKDGGKRDRSSAADAAAILAAN